MDDQHDNLIDPSTRFSSVPTCWPPLRDGDSYFFGIERDSSILSEFGWNFPSHSDFDRIDSDVHGSNSTITVSLPEDNMASEITQAVQVVGIKAGDVVFRSNPSISSNSTEDKPEISTASGGGGGGNSTSETAGKVEKKAQKRIRQQRFAFVTKSEVDHLEDGYRWRKYGQKAVKNSPFPRSYYRCTNSKCTVKKRVERSSEDPSHVMTTYEGQHCHHTAGFPRGGLVMNEGIYPNQFTPFPFPTNNPRAPFPREDPLSISQPREFSGEARDHIKSLDRQTQRSSQNHSDQGLLGDMVPPGMRNQ